MIDAKSFWQVLGQRAIGVSIVTAKGVDGPAGFLGLSAAHVSADPPSMLVSIDDRTSALAAVMHSRHFAVNYLPANSKNLAEIFSGRAEAKGAQRFELDDWETLMTGAPVLKSAVGVFDCNLETTFRHGSTTIVLGRVIAQRTKEGEALVFYRGKYLAM